MSGPQANPTEDVCALTSTDLGYQARCSCGWEGPERDRMSDDYAWTNAREDVKSHERKHKEATRG